MLSTPEEVLQLTRSVESIDPHEMTAIRNLLVVRLPMTNAEEETVLFMPHLPHDYRLRRLVCARPASLRTSPMRSFAI